MDSSGNNQSPWAPYDTYKDCSRGICSIYCPQWCYIIFPPPPPSSGDAGSDTYFSPLVIAVIGLLASAFLMVSYYTIITKYCRRRRIRGGSDNHISDLGDVDGNQMAWQNAAMGLDEAVIKSITVCKYRRGDGLIEGTDCSVCLNEFQEDESLRLLPKCNHAFHLPCIDTWLKSHSTCPLCRSNIVYNAETPPRTSPRAPQSPITAVETPLGANINDPLSVHRAETVVVIDDDDSRTAVYDEASVIAIAVDVPDSVASSKTLSCVPRSAEDRRTSEFVGQDDGVQRMRRSFSLDSSFSRGGAGASWSYNEEEEVGDSIQTENNRQISTGSGSSAPCDGEDSNSNHGTKGVPQPQVDKPTPPDMRRSLSISTIGRNGKARINSMQPN